MVVVEAVELWQAIFPLSSRGDGPRPAAPPAGSSRDGPACASPRPRRRNGRACAHPRSPAGSGRASPAAAGPAPRAVGGGRSSPGRFRPGPPGCRAVVAAIGEGQVKADERASTAARHARDADRGRSRPASRLVPRLATSRARLAHPPVHRSGRDAAAASRPASMRGPFFARAARSGNVAAPAPGRRAGPPASPQRRGSVHAGGSWRTRPW